MEDRLDWMLSRAAVLELYLESLQGTLAGDTPGARFRSFLASAATPAKALAFFAEYPVLARLVLETIDHWQAASCELLDRLGHDWRAIRSEFHPAADPGPLHDISGGTGDLHCRGRSVRMLTFLSGFRLIYKPRPIGVNARFAELLQWLNERGAPGLTAARVLEREGYGWMEFVAAHPCADREGIERFYRRQGAFLALFYALNTNDMHWENLVAQGEHPVFIDLECLLGADYGQFDPDSYDSLAHFEINNSVMRVMLLPFFHGNVKQDVIEPSGLGGEQGQLAVDETPFWENPGTDQMRLSRRRTVTSQGHHRPTLGQKAANPLEFRRHLEEGFVSLYQLLLDHRDALLTEGSPLARFAGDEVRSTWRAAPRRDTGSAGLASAAAAISARLHERALSKDGSAAWLGLARTRSRGWWLRPLDADLYGGLPGVALYLAYAGEVLGRPQDTQLARQALASLDRQLERLDRVPFVGGFEGWGGLVYVWLQLAILWRDDGLMEKAIGALARIAELVDEDEDLDVIRGAAGGIVALLALYRATGCADALLLARRMGERIVAAAQVFRGGLCWRTASFPIHPLTGLSHGNAGFAWAL
jgi:lantibiotic modifying enzyme